MLILILGPFTLYEEEQPTLIMLLFNMFQNKEENGKFNKITFDIIKCVSLFTFYRFQAIKCARRQPSTFYGIEIGKK